MDEYQGFKIGDRVKFEKVGGVVDFGTIIRFDQDTPDGVRVWAKWESEGREQYISDASALTLAPSEVPFEDMLCWYVEKFGGANFYADCANNSILTVKKVYRDHHEKVPQHLVDAKDALEKAGYTVTK